MKTKLHIMMLFVLFMSFLGHAQTQLTACDTNFNGTEAFDLTSAIPELLNGNDPAQYTVGFFISETNAIANVNPITNPTSYTNISNPQLIWVRFVNTSSSEVIINLISLQVNPIPNPGTAGTAVFCENSTANDLFNYLGGTPEAGGTWSPTLSSGTSVFDPSQDTSGIYTYTIIGTPPCINSTASVTVTVNAIPNPGTAGTAVFCENSTANDLFNYLGGTPEAGGTWSPTLSSGTSVFDPSQDTSGIYTYTIIGTPPCINSTASVTVTVNAIPNLVTEVATACDDNGDGIALFDLNEAIQITLEGNNATPNTMSVTFYMTEADMQTQSNPIGTFFENQFPNQTIYIRIDNLLTGCYWGGQFFLFVQDCTSSCVAPTNLSTTNSTETSAVLGWTNASNAIVYEIFVVPTGSPAPDANSEGIIANTNPYVLVGLTCNTSYTYYVKAYCNNQTVSEWSVGSTFMTSECGNTNIPYVTVNTNSFTTEQLLNNVILNSSCGDISNVITQGQCGVGYFNSNQGDFPFEQGMVIRSGQANFTEGVYNSGTSSSTCSQFTDPDLTAIMQAMGQTGSINDVTSVKFNIVPTGNILSFNFLFASNEYGLYQCQFSDVFGFILTDLTTGQSQNIAVVPGTDTPISTTTIRNNAHNLSCPSANAQFFSTYNIDNPLSTVNMAGYTVPMTAIASVIPNREYSLKLAVGDFQDTAFDSAVFIEGGSLALGNQCRNNIQVIAFLDANNNGVKEANEPNFTNGNLLYQMNNTGETTTATASNGVFYVYPENETDSYDFTYEIYSELAGYYATPISFDDIVYSDSSENVYYIPIVNTSPYNDVAVSLVGTNQPAAGFTYQNKIYYTNNGIAATSGTLTFEKDAALTISSISVSGTATNPTGFTYDYANLMPGEMRIITVSMPVPPIPTVAIGDLVTNMVSISASTADVNSENNIASLTRPIVASYDPNDKNETHGKNIEFSSFTSDDYLYYTIRFQNTGTTNATFVRLEDVLDAQVNPESLRMVSASHPYTLERVNNQLVWKFDNIQLVPQLVNETASIGFVHFKIKPTAGFAVGTVIPNTAEIYFDFNPAIITNTFESIFVENLSTPTFMNSTAVLSPNPTHDNLQIQLKGNDFISQLTVFDLLGKRIYFKDKVDLNTTSIDFSSYKEGVYFVEVVTTSQQVIRKKVIKQ